MRLIALLLVLMGSGSFNGFVEAQNTALQSIFDELSIINRIINAVALQNSAIKRSLTARSVIIELLEVKPDEFSDLMKQDAKTVLDAVQKYGPTSTSLNSVPFANQDINNWIQMGMETLGMLKEALELKLDDSVDFEKFNLDDVTITRSERDQVWDKFKMLTEHKTIETQLLDVLPTFVEFGGIPNMKRLAEVMQPFKDTTVLPELAKVVDLLPTGKAPEFIEKMKKVMSWMDGNDDKIAVIHDMGGLLNDLGDLVGGIGSIAKILPSSFGDMAKLPEGFGSLMDKVKGKELIEQMLDGSSDLKDLIGMMKHMDRKGKGKELIDKLGEQFTKLTGFPEGLDIFETISDMMGMFTGDLDANKFVGLFKTFTGLAENLTGGFNPNSGLLDFMGGLGVQTNTSTLKEPATYSAEVLNAIRAKDRSEFWLTPQKFIDPVIAGIEKLERSIPNLLASKDLMTIRRVLHDAENVPGIPKFKDMFEKVPGYLRSRGTKATFQSAIANANELKTWDMDFAKHKQALSTAYLSLESVSWYFDDIFGFKKDPRKSGDNVTVINHNISYWAVGGMCIGFFLLCAFVGFLGRNIAVKINEFIDIKKYWSGTTYNAFLVLLRIVCYGILYCLIVSFVVLIFNVITDLWYHHGESWHIGQVAITVIIIKTTRFLAFVANQIHQNSRPQRNIFMRGLSDDDVSTNPVKTSTFFCRDCINESGIRQVAGARFPNEKDISIKFCKLKPGHLEKQAMKLPELTDNMQRFITFLESGDHKLYKLDNRIHSIALHCYESKRRMMREKGDDSMKEFMLKYNTKDDSEYHQELIRCMKDVKMAMKCKESRSELLKRMDVCLLGFEEKDECCVFEHMQKALGAVPSVGRHQIRYPSPGTKTKIFRDAWDSYHKREGISLELANDFLNRFMKLSTSRYQYREFREFPWSTSYGTQLIKDIKKSIQHPEVEFFIPISEASNPEWSQPTFHAKVFIIKKGSLSYYDPIPELRNQVFKSQRWFEKAFGMKCTEIDGAAQIGPSDCAVYVLLFLKYRVDGFLFSDRDSEEAVEKFYANLDNYFEPE